MLLIPAQKARLRPVYWLNIPPLRGLELAQAGSEPVQDLLRDGTTHPKPPRGYAVQFCQTLTDSRSVSDEETR